MAQTVARQAATDLNLAADFERGDDEGTRLIDADTCQGMLSIRLPVALVTNQVHAALVVTAPA